MPIHRPQQDRLVPRLRLDDGVPEARPPRNLSVREFPVSGKNVIAPLRVVGVRQLLFPELIHCQDGLTRHHRNHQKNLLHARHPTPHRNGVNAVGGGW